MRGAGDSLQILCCVIVPFNFEMTWVGLKLVLSQRTYKKKLFHERQEKFMEA